MRIFNQISKRNLLAVFLLLVGSCLHAQVTIGNDNIPGSFSVLEISSKQVKGGLRLPHLSTFQRDSLALEKLTGNDLIAAKGLTIFNTSTNCFNYWNTQKWVSLCQGEAEITFLDESKNEVDPTKDPFGSSESEKGPFTTVDNPNCTTQDPAFDFLVMTGNEYTSIKVLDPSIGKFTVKMDINTTAAKRTSIVRITNNCTKEYKDLLFVQDADATLCGAGKEVPEIMSENSKFTLCENGALYLYLKDYNGGNFIWTLNGQPVGLGAYYVATRPGTYIVYSEAIGCSNRRIVQVEANTAIAPAPVDFIVVGNNGVVCGESGTVELLVTTTPSGATVTWYKDGRKTGLIGEQISAGKGEWFAVVQEGECLSTPTKSVKVVVNPDTNPVDDNLKMRINGSESNQQLCIGGLMHLEAVSNVPELSYTWYIDNTEIGKGASLYYPVPSIGKFALRLRATASVASCASEVLKVATLSAEATPGAPFINTNTNGYLCGGEATLTARPSNYTSYHWFMDGKEIIGQDKNTATITVNQPGSYTVCAVSGTCISAISGAREVKTSDFATVKWVNNPDKVNLGETKIYSLGLDFPEGATYDWFTLPPGSVLLSGQGTSYISLQFPSDMTPETYNIECRVKNACGNAVGDDVVGGVITTEVMVSTGCEPTVITATSDLNPIIKEGESTTLSVTAQGTQLTYQWYKSGFPISGATNSSYTYNATEGANFYEFYCIVKSPVAECSTPVESSIFKVKVDLSPVNMPSGTGSFTGKTCFDIASASTNVALCGTADSRSARKTDFSIRDSQDPADGSVLVFSGVQVYTFKPSGTVYNLRFDYVDPTGNNSIIKDISPKTYAQTTVSSGTSCKVTVSYNEGLNTTLKGLTRQNALKADLYAIYTMTHGGEEYAVKLTATLQDCGCCGAETSSGWLEFMCHNLGANESLDPFTRVEGNDDGTGGTLGYLFQWGRRADGHQKRNSPVTKTLSTTDIPDHGNFIEVPSYAPYDWRGNADEASKSRWGNGAQDANPPKGVNDPCPPGWKVPSPQQWKDVVEYNRSKGKVVYITNNGYKIGDALFLPNTGQRRGYNGAGAIDSPNGQGSYWSSMWKTTYNSFAYSLQFSPTGITAESAWPRGNGLAIRCVAE